MSSALPIYQQADPINVPIRPLSLGMIRNQPEGGIPRGAMLRAENFIVGSKGAYRRPAWVRAIGTPVDYPPVQEVIQLWKSDGTQQVVVVDSKFVYEWSLGSDTLTGKYLVYSTGTASSSGTTVTGAGGAAWVTGDIKTGDVMVLDANGTGDGPEEIEIDAVGGETTITLVSTPVGTYGAGTDYEIRKAMNPQAPNMLDWVIADNKIIFVDGERYPFSYDGTTFGVYHASITIKPRCVAYFLDRVWFGGYVSGSTDYRQYMQWTLTTNRQTLSGYSLGLPYIPGALRRLLPLGVNLVAYFDDSVWLGRQTGIAGDALPVAFTRIDTTGMGLIGPRAVVELEGAHFMVGSDDVYPITNRGVEKPIGTPVAAEMLDGIAYPWLVRCAVDFAQKRVVVGVPTSSEQIERIWSYHTKAGVWSYDNLYGDTLCSSSAASSLTWDTYGSAPYATGTISGTGTTVTGSGGQAFDTEVEVGATVFVDTDGDGWYETSYEVDSVTDATHFETTATVVDFTADPYYIVNPEDSWEQIPYLTWFAFGSEVSMTRNLYLGRDGYVCTFQDDQTLDNGAEEITAILETGDDDAGSPDDDKTYLRFGVRIDRALTANLSVGLRYSLDQGETWTTPSYGNRTIVAGKRETFFGIRGTGSQIRFEVTFRGSVESFYVTEMTYRVIGRGLEVSVS